MKKKIAWILALVILCTLPTACGGQEPSQDTANIASGQMTSEEMDEITYRLLADWYGYIIRCEYLYGDIRWALSYLDPFFEDHSWDSLQKARAALCLAKRRTEAVGPVEAQMTFDDYDKLVQSGANVGPVQLAVDSIQSLKDSVLLDYRLYRNYSNSPAEEFFLEYEMTHFQNWTGLMQKIYDNYLLQCAVETDYLLLSIDNEEAEAHFNETISVNCPQINALRRDNPQDPDALLERSAKLQDELETLTNELNTVIGQARAALELYNDRLSEAEATNDVNGFVSVISADAVELNGFPIALPYPDWWYETEDEIFMYVWDKGEEDEQSYIMPGDTIETPPDQFLVKWTDVSLEEYQAYLRMLEKYQIPAHSATEEDGRHISFYQFQSAEFVLDWEDGTVSLFTTKGSVCFAPPWYILYTHSVSS